MTGHKMSDGNSSDDNRVLPFIAKRPPVREIIAPNNKPRAGGVCKRTPQLIREIAGTINSLVLKKKMLCKAFARFKALQNEYLELIDELEKLNVEIMNKNQLTASDLSDTSL